MKSKFKLQASITTHKQRGVVLFFALMALLAMSLAAVALIRSVDTSTLIAGNLSFKQSTATSADIGVEAAITWLDGIEAANTALNVASNTAHPFNQTALAANPGYYSNLDPTLDITAAGTWNGTKSVCLPTDNDTGNTVCYIIQRMCRTANVAIKDASCLLSGALQDNNGNAIPLPQDICVGAGCPAAGQTPQIRITAKSSGPKFSVSYIQAFVY
jgi:Tfp pilus assembly protein PilX